ncbi:MAG: thiamine-phosphate kinase, partial [Deltaproteobacteria bacterium]|nr:thiamine-phosphate kinase [Deltaproteobacteria bacterium]
MDEFERIDEIRARLTHGGPSAASIRLGVGDDAALLSPSAYAQALSVDTAVEGVHFRLDFGPPERLGRRAMMTAASDLAAMGARPRCCLSSLVLPDSFADDSLLRLVDGIARAARELDMPVVGGNLSRGARLSITTTVVGELLGPALTRSGARPGDVLYLSGPLGEPALGLRVLLERPEDAIRMDACVRAWFDLRPAIDEGMNLVGHATACIDVSDGFAQDCLHLLRASGVGARVQLDELPRAPGFE